MNAWIECPDCKGVLKISTARLEGPCLFCRVPLRVMLSVEMLNDERAAGTVADKKAPQHQVGKGPMPKLRPVVRHER